MLKKFVLGGMVVAAALLGNACGGDSSSDSAAGPADGEATLSSSSICEDCDESSSSVTPQNVSLSEAEGSSSSETGVSSSSTKDSILSSDDTGISSSLQNDKSSSSEKSSSSSVKVEESSSSAKVDESSSSMKAAESSSSVKVEESSSSEKNEISSSSEKPVESSSSEKIEESSSSEKLSSSSAKSSSSMESSSSVESSSSIMSIYDAENNTLTDLRDNQVYKTVTIGEQIWMAENLNYMPEDTAGTIYSGGTVCGGGENNSLKDSERCDTFGRLYLRKVALYKTTVSNRQGICPDGWSIPQKTDWEKLEVFVGKDAGKLKVTGGAWSSGTNESGFSLKPAGMFFSQAYGYDQLKRSYLFYWSSNNKPYLVYICDEDNQFHYAHAAAEVMIGVRCIKD